MGKEPEGTDIVLGPDLAVTPSVAEVRRSLAQRLLLALHFSVCLMLPAFPLRTLPGDSDFVLGPSEAAGLPRG